MFYPRKGKIRENFNVETSRSRYRKLNWHTPYIHNKVM